MRLYGATLFDVTDEQPVTPFQLPSSSLVSCTQDVTFSFVEAGHRYVASVRAYDRTDIELQRLGSPNAVDDSGKVVQPRWTTECGRAPLDLETLGAGGEGGATGEDTPGSAGAAGAPSEMFEVEGVTSSNTFTVFANYCAPLSDHGVPRPAAVRVGLGAALREMSCGSSADQVFDFSVTLLGDATEEQRAECGSAALFSDLTPGVDVSFSVEAFAEGSSTPGWTTECRARPELGTTIDADCDPLSPADP